MEDGLQVLSGFFFAINFVQPSPTEGLATEGVCGAITVIGDGQGPGPSWSGVMQETGDTARITSILAASVSVVIPENKNLCTLISAEAGCDEAAVDRLEASVTSVTRREPGLVTFTCAGAGGHEGSLHCNGSHWTGDTQMCRGDK